MDDIIYRKLRGNPWAWPKPVESNKKLSIDFSDFFGLSPQWINVLGFYFSVGEIHLLLALKRLMFSFLSLISFFFLSSFCDFFSGWGSWVPTSRVQFQQVHCQSHSKSIEHSHEPVHKWSLHLLHWGLSTFCIFHGNRMGLLLIQKIYPFGGACLNTICCFHYLEKPCTD